MSRPLPFSDAVLLLAAGAAAGSVALAAAGLLAARLSRRADPLRHGLLLTTLLILLALPLLVPAAATCGYGWRAPIADLTRLVQQARPTDPHIQAGSPEPESAVTSFNVSAPRPPGAPVTESVTLTPVPVEIDVRFVEQPDAGPATDPASTPTISADSPRPILVNEPPPASNDWSQDAWRAAGNLLLFLWILGGGASLLRSLVACLRLHRLRRHSAPVTDPLLINLLADVARAAPLKRTPRLLAGDVPVPFIHGLVRPAVVLPSVLLADSPAALRLVLIHEVAHIRRRDLLVGRLQAAVQVLYWWNPLIRRLNSKLAETREDLCDNHVLQQTGDPQAYARTLVETASRLVGVPTFPAIGLFTRTQPPFSQRIDRLLQENRPMSTSLGRLSRILLVVFAFVLGAASTLFVVIKTDAGDSVSFFGAGSAFRLIDVQDPAAEALPVSRVSDYVPAEEPGSVERRMPEPWIIEDEIEAPSLSPEMAFADVDAGSDSGGFSLDSLPADQNESLAIPEDTGFAPPLVSNDPAADFTNPVPPVASPPVDAALPPTEVTPADPLAPTPIGPHDLDPFGAPTAVPSLPFTTGAPPAEGPQSPTPATQKGLIIIRLVGNEDGSLKELRYLTDDLGSDGTAFETLNQRIEAWTQTVGPNGHSRDTEVQIVADPALRYEHVARVVSICEPLVDRVSFARAESDRQLVIAVGFLRDPTGTKVIDQPVAFIGEGNVPGMPMLVRSNELFDQLNMWKSENEQQFTEGVTIVIRSDADVDYKFIEGLVREAQRAGFERFSLKSLEQTTETAIERRTGKIIGIQSGTDSTMMVVISFGVADGIHVGQRLLAYRQAPEAPSGPNRCAQLEVVRITSEVSECRLVGFKIGPPEIGDTVARVPDHFIDDLPDTVPESSF